MAHADTDTLARLVRRKHDCLAQLLDLGREQQALVNDGDLNDLLRVLAAKQRWLAVLQETQRELVPFRDQVPAERRWASEAERQQCAHLLKRCEAMLGEIVAQEKQSEMVLQQRRDDASARLQGMHTADKARTAYVTNGAEPIRQLDLSSEG